MIPLANDQNSAGVMTVEPIEGTQNNFPIDLIVENLENLSKFKLDSWPVIDYKRKVIEIEQSPKPKELSWMGFHN